MKIISLFGQGLKQSLKIATVFVPKAQLVKLGLMLLNQLAESIVKNTESTADDKWLASVKRLSKQIKIVKK